MLMSLLGKSWQEGRRCKTTQERYKMFKQANMKSRSYPAPTPRAAVYVHAERGAPAAGAYPYSDKIVTEYN